jgi:hypothetical protein
MTSGLPRSCFRSRVTLYAWRGVGWSDRALGARDLGLATAAVH